MILKRNTACTWIEKISYNAMSLALRKLKKRPLTDGSAKPKRTIDRFAGLTEEEVQKQTLEDILAPDLDLVFVGINPGLMSAYRGRYYAGPGNHFYKLLHESGLVPRFVGFKEDHNLLNYKIGLTNIVARATRSSADLKKSEIKEGSTILRQKLHTFKPRIAIFNGKCIYEVFADKSGKSDFYFGLQPERVGETAIWVVPSSSARCAHFPRMADKLHFYLALKKYLDFLKSKINDFDTKEFRFEGKCKQSIPSTSKMWRRKDVSAFMYGGRVANKETVCLDTSEDDIAIVNSTEFIVTEILGRNNEDLNEKVTNCENETIKPGVNENSDEEKTSSKLKMDQEAKFVENNSKRSLKRSGTLKTLSSVSACKSREKSDATDFMNLIKQRLSEKKDRDVCEEKIAKISSQPVGAGKKLKYSNLRLNSCKKTLNVKVNLPETSLKIEDPNSSFSSD